MKLRAIETGQISRGLLILVVRKLKTKAIPMVKWIAQLLRIYPVDFTGKQRKLRGKRPVLSEKNSPLVKPELLRLRLSSYHDPQKSFSKRKKQLTPTKNWLEIIQNGVECKAMKDTGLLEIEKKPYYSYLLAMSPRIATNRGCIRLEGNGRRNIDFVQVI